MKHSQTLREHGDKPLAIECRNEYNYCILCNNWFPRRDSVVATNADEFVDEVGPLPQCLNCGLALGVCGCSKSGVKGWN